MQTSVRSESPRPADVKSFSDESVRVSREISIVSSRARTPSIIPSLINDHVPAEYAPGITSITAQVHPNRPQLDRWNSRKSDKSWRHSRRASTLAPRASQDADMLHDNRESMKALSDFLMTREPPPNNFMSISSDDEKSVSSLKRSALKLFGKQKNSTKQPGLMRLPDSAIAAHTRSGARHIAISIPMAHEHVEESTSFRPPNPLRFHPPTRLNSVAEVRESFSMNFTQGRTSKDETIDGGIGPQSPELRTDESTRNVNATKIMSAYHPDSEPTARSTRREPPLAKYDQRPQESYMAVSPNDQQADLRHSSGTIYSQMSFACIGMGHSRNISSVSTAPSATLISSLELDSHPRGSSIPKVPRALQRELAIASTLADAEPAKDEPLSPSQYAESEGTSPSPPTVYGIAVRGYNASPVGRRQVETQRSHTPNPSTDTTRGAEHGIIPRPSTAPPPRTKHLIVSRTNEAVKRTTSSRDSRTESILVTRQSRQERVRAKKLRDIESVRSRSGPRRRLSESTATKRGQNPTPVTAPRNPKKSLNSGRRATINTLSPIMLVANLPPFTGYVTKSDLPLQRSSRQSRSVAPNSPESTIRSTQTPPRSITTSFDSDSDTDIDQPTSSGKSESKRCSPTKSLRSSVLSTRRQERRAKRNMGLREKEIDARMSKIESDNIMLSQTLGGIARSFGGISRVGKESRRERKTERLLDEEWKPSAEEKRRRSELEKMEPVMRDMAVLMPRVSMEIHKARDGEEKDHDSDDALSILG